MDGTGRYPGTSGHVFCANLGGTAEADISSRPLFKQGMGAFFSFHSKEKAKEGEVK
jgi:hypothetical protein